MVLREKVVDEEPEKSSIFSIKVIGIGRKVKCVFKVAESLDLDFASIREEAVTSYHSDLVEEDGKPN
jgi:hypothetical protein